MFKFLNGDEVFETYTEFTGIIVGRTQWGNGQITYMVQPKAIEEGSVLPEYEIFDEDFLEVKVD